MRPKDLLIGNVLYWVIRTRDPDTQVLKDADSTPTVAIRKNGASTADSVTITKRSAATGIYDCSYNPAGEAEGDSFTVEESATVTGTTTDAATYTNSWAFGVVAVERGTNGANTVVPTNLSAAQVRTELTTELARIDATISSRSTFAGGAVLSVTNPVTVGTNNDKTGYALTQAFPANFAALGVNASGHVSRVVLVDTTTTNTDMRGTDSAATAANLALVNTEIGKIPRGASAIAAGGNATRTKVSADGTTLVEAIT